MYEGITIFAIIIGIGLIVWSFFKEKTAKSDTEVIRESRNIPESLDFESQIDEMNHKILELNEFSEYIQKELEKKHEELLFLYQMIGEKMKAFEKINKSPDKPVETVQFVETVNSVENVQTKNVDKPQVISEPVQPNKMSRMILELSEKGYDVTAIAQMLDIGQGEVRLVLSLYE